MFLNEYLMRVKVSGKTKQGSQAILSLLICFASLIGKQRLLIYQTAFLQRKVIVFFPKGDTSGSPWKRGGNNSMKTPKYLRKGHLHPRINNLWGIWGGVYFDRRWKYYMLHAAITQWYKSTFLLQEEENRGKVVTRPQRVTVSAAYKIQLPEYSLVINVKFTCHKYSSIY